MVFKMQEKNHRILLPFASFKNSVIEKFDDNIEKASIFCLAELDREKGGGLFKKKPPEKLGFIAKAYYPFRVVPFRDFALLFDGLCLATHVIKTPVSPDIKCFRDMMSNLTTRQAYSTFLLNQCNYFKNLNNEKEKGIDGLICDPEFLREILLYTKEAKTSDDPVLDGILVTPSCDDNQIREVVKNLDETYKEITSELKSLDDAIKQLNVKTQACLKDMREEIQGVDERFRGQIKAAQKASEDKKLKINKEYDVTVTEVTKKFEDEIVSVQKEIVKLEKTKDEINLKISKIEKEIKNATINKDNIAEEKWKGKRDEIKNQLPRNTQLIENLQTKIQNIEENKKAKLFQLQQDNEVKLKNASKELLDLESAKDAEKRIIQNEMEKIEDVSSRITIDIDNISKTLEASLIEFDKLGVRKENQPFSLVYMPFYLIYYLVDSTRRFSFIAPSFVSCRDLSTKLKAIGKKKITQFLQPRSQKIISTLNKFMVLLGEDVAFSHEIAQACNKLALLRSIEAIDEIKKGLEELEKEGWLSETELESFKQSLS